MAKGKIYSDEVHSLRDFRRWLLDRQLPPHAGTNYIDWLNPAIVLEKFAAAMRGKK